MANSLIELYNDPTVNLISTFGGYADQLESAEVKRLYGQLLSEAPRRGERGKKYFVDKHSGVTSSGGYSNRNEEHLAVALFNASRDGLSFDLPENRKLLFLDYQVPLKAHQTDKGIGKVDLFGAIDCRIPAVVELKVSNEKGQMGDTPLRALLEGLAYCAIVEANIDTITREGTTKFGINLKSEKPAILIMAPLEYWSGYLKKTGAGEWATSVKSLANRIYKELDISIHFLALRNAKFELGLNNKPPTFKGDCRIESVQALTPNHS